MFPKLYRFDKVRFKGDGKYAPYPETYIWVFVLMNTLHDSFFIIEHPQGYDKSTIITQNNIKSIWADQLNDKVKYIKVDCDGNGGNNSLELIESYPGGKEAFQQYENQLKSAGSAPIIKDNGNKVQLYRVLNALNYPVYEGYDEKKAQNEFIKYADDKGGNYYMKMSIEVLEQTKKYLYSKKQGKFLK